MTTTAPSDRQRQAGPAAPPPSTIGRVVALSMSAGLVAAAGLVALPFVPVREHVLTAMVLLGCAVGWGLLAVLSVRRTAHPQRWAAALAAFLAVAGLASLTGSAVVDDVLMWGWPPTLLVLAVWSLRRARRQLPGRGTRRTVSLVLAGLVLASAAGGYEVVRESLDARAYPAPGRLVDVGGHRLHLSCAGAGSPTVVLEPGLGAASYNLSWIAADVARSGRVCVYDRAGRGWSDPTDGPQDGAHIAADLHTLLERASEPGPYVLAGHSFGGLYVQSFAAQYPAEVAGLVLLDSTAPRPGQAGPTDTPSQLIRRLAALLPVAAHLGVERLLAQSSFGSLPARSRDEARARSSTAAYRRSSIEELLAGDASTRQAASLTTLEDKPLIVLTADTGHDAAWRVAQEQMTQLSSNRRHRLAHASHSSLIGDQNDSRAASKAIRDVVASVRTGRHLAN